MRPTSTNGIFMEGLTGYEKPRLIYNRKLLFFVTIFSLFFGCLSIANDKPSLDKRESPEITSSDQWNLVEPTGIGIWQVHYLPQTWVNEHLASRDVKIAYIFLAAPHRLDLDGAFSPCGPPYRIILGLVGKHSPPREKLARCLYYCDKDDGVEGFHRDLWGSMTQLEGVNIQIIESGALDVIQHYREKAFSPPKEVEDPSSILVKIPLGQELKIRHSIIQPEEFDFHEKEAGSCSDLFRRK